MEIIELFQEIKIPATILHVVTVVIGMGAALVSDILFTFFGKDKKLNATELSTLAILSKVVLYSLIGIVLSGVMIFLTDIEKYSQAPKFLAKMSILGVLVVNGVVLQRYVWPHLVRKNFFTLQRERGMRKLAFGAGAVSVVSWLAVCILGILDTVPLGYSSLISIYGAMLLGAIGVALVVEKRALN